MPITDILSREKDLQKNTYQHEILVKGTDFEACKAKVLQFFERYQLVRYSQIDAAQDASLAAGDPDFDDRLQKAILKNREILHALRDELQREGVDTLHDLSALPQGYKTKMLHVITHLLDGFFGIDTYFYNLEEDSHWVSDTLIKKIHTNSSYYWLLTIEAKV
jgi:hypothetical protein